MDKDRPKKVSTAPFRCSSCGAVNEVEVHPLINVSADPELKRRVRDGSLFVWECPHCGKKNLAPYRCVYHDPENRLLLWLLPEDGTDGVSVPEVDRSELPEGYVLRRVCDTGSLIEKINIHEARLDDVVVELCKWVTASELCENDKDGFPERPVLRFLRLEGADNDMLFVCPHGGKMDLLSVGFNVYEDCAGILSRNPSVTPGDGLARVDSDWLSTFFG